MNLSSDWQLTATKLESQITEFAVLLVGKVGAELHPIGSGVFIAAGLVMTAKHVIAEFWTRLGPGTPFSGGDEKKGFFDIVIVQYPGEKAEAALWLTSIGFGAKFSDIAFLSVKPANDLATSYKFSRLPMLNALPPAVGERVFGFGYPSSEVLKSTEELMQFALHPTTTSGFVTTIYPEYRDRGMLTFPCFEINTHFIGGMSGGPLYNEAGQLCGLICASQNDQPIAYGATLWASLGTNITHEFDGITCTGPAPVFELATIGRMFLTGWDEIVPRIEIQHDPFGKELLRLKATT